MNLIYQIIFGLVSVGWMFICFFLGQLGKEIEFPFVGKKDITVYYVIISFFVELILCYCCVFLFKKLRVARGVTSCKFIESCDYNFLPIFLGYFLAAFTVSDFFILMVIYLFTFISLFLIRKSCFYNPTLLVFGYHIYKITTNNDNVIYLITKQKNINKFEFELGDIVRLTDNLFIEIGER